MPLEKNPLKLHVRKRITGWNVREHWKKKRKETTVIWNIALYFNGATRTERIFFNALPADEMVALLARQTVSFLFRLVRYTKFIHNGNFISKHCQQWSPIFFLRHFCFAFFFLSIHLRFSTAVRLWISLSWQFARNAIFAHGYVDSSELLKSVCVRLIWVICRCLLTADARRQIKSFDGAAAFLQLTWNIAFVKTFNYRINKADVEFYIFYRSTCSRITSVLSRCVINFSNRVRKYVNFRRKETYFNRRRFMIFPCN